MKESFGITSLVSEQQLNMVLFRLDKQIYGVPIEQVRQIIEIVTITPIPQVNHSVEGIINFHGSAVPVVNLRKHLSLPQIPVRLHTPIVLVTIHERLAGLLVDDVMDVVPVGLGQMVNPADILPMEVGDVPIILGIVQTELGMTIVLNLEHLFKPQHAQALFRAADAMQLQDEFDPEGGTDDSGGEPVSADELTRAAKTKKPAKVSKTGKKPARDRHQAGSESASDQQEALSA